MELSPRHNEIISIVREKEPITSKEIAEGLHLSRAALRADLSVLVRAGILYARPNVGYFYNKNSNISFMKGNIDNIKIKDIYSLPVVVTEETKIYDAIVTLFMEDTGSLFVTDKNGDLSGIVSRKDIIKAILGKLDINQVPIGVIMTRMPNIITIDPEDTITFAANKMIEHEVDSMPVIKKGETGQKVIGKISKTTITKFFAELFKDF